MRIYEHKQVGRTLITAMVLGIGFLGEKLTLELVAGMGLVLVGILVGSGVYSAWRRPSAAL